MQQRIDAFETFKCEAIPQPRTTSRSLVLPAPSRPASTPLKPADQAAQYAAARINGRSTQFRHDIVIAVFLWLALLLGCLAILFFAAGGKI
jgi:hypothetical protein